MLPIGHVQRLERVEQTQVEFQTLLDGDEKRLMTGILPMLRGHDNAINRQSRVLESIEHWMKDQTPRIDQGVQVAEAMKILKRDTRMLIAGGLIALTLITGGGWIAVLRLVQTMTMP